MTTIHHIVITLITCFCLALPATAQKNPFSLQRALIRAGVAQTPPLTVKTLKIINLPTKPSVKIHVNVPPVPPVKNSVRLIPPRQVYLLLDRSAEHKMFVPRDFVDQTETLYRGMAIKGIDELKNILVNGLEINESYYKKIFTSYNPFTSLLYACPNFLSSKKANLPVLIKIPVTPALEQYEQLRYGADDRAFLQNIPANAISDVWILLEVNKKADWYKVFLENGEIVLFPAYGQLQDVP